MSDLKLAVLVTAISAFACGWMAHEALSVVWDAAHDAARFFARVAAIRRAHVRRRLTRIETALSIREFR